MPLTNTMLQDNMEEMYKGMNPTYYVGLQSVFKFNPADKIENQNEFLDGSPGSRGSGSSSNTATQMTTMDQGEGAALNMMAEAARQAVLPLLDRPLPVRRRQRKPNRKTVKTDIPAVTSTIRNRGRRPRATDPAAGARPRPTRATNAPQGDNVASAQKRLEVKAPPNPPLPRARPPRNTPKKMWDEEEAEAGAWWGKKGGAAQEAMVEEEDTDYTDYSPPQARKGRAPGPKKAKQVQEGGSSHPNRKKAGGPCVLCFATKSATWRRGAQGRPHVGLPLCNKCGVWEFRHPNSPPRVCVMMDEAALEAQLQADMEVELQQQEGQQEDVQRVIQGGQQRVTGRRRRAGARGAARCVNDSGRAAPEQPSVPVQHEEATTSAVLRTTAVSAAATAAATAPASRLQQCSGNNVVARVPKAAQNSQVQPWAQSGFATANTTGNDQGVQLRRVGGPKLSRKRAAEEDDIEDHAAKRWQGSVDGSASQTPSLGGGASAARVLKGVRSSMAAEQDGLGLVVDGTTWHTTSVLESATTMDES